MDPIELNSGLLVYTGCQVPSERPETFRVFSDMAPMLTKDQIRAILAYTNRKPARLRFPGRKWIKRQLINSCNGYMAADLVAKARVEKGLSEVQLSGCSVYAQISGGRDQGSMLDDGMHALMSTGCSPFDMVPETVYRWEDVPETAKQEMYRFKALKCFRIEDDDMLASAIAQDYFCGVAVHVYRNFVVDDAGWVGATDGPGNHAIVLDDIVGETSDGFTYDNPQSWGLDFGIDGRCKLNWRRNLRGPSERHAFYAIQGVIDDPLSPLPPGI